MNLISATNGNIVFHKNKTLVVRDIATGAIEKIDAPSRISFMSGKYLADGEKNLHFIEGPTLRNVLKLNRCIFCLVEYENEVYVADRFGDVHRIRGERYEYVLGTLSYLTGMAIHNGRILLSDKYGRIRISGMDGKILGYRFGCGPIVSLECINGALVSISNKQIVLYDKEYSSSFIFELPEGTSVVKSMGKGKDELVVICSDSYFLFRIGDGIALVSHIEETIIDGVCSGSVFYKVLPNFTIVDGNEKVFYE
ncbi:hypothetical protein EROM_041310 [Encephalitozoon romaleae SJ-2008]|uniref:Uncharacterized protein n=1 Tax=Encephalitozoon romaleae (strain SJ-2008) TaxID=1178016 RepID=I7ARA4_ENCRO|nr:hypothetical protein EROM_041310 [Encephalitozoon romaleae SJ-2008]AFN82897.1 hypothetical protein EROM_041310 [Encephalitozoon romaleae SJ-2008]